MDMSQWRGLLANLITPLLWIWSLLCDVCRNVKSGLCICVLGIDPRLRRRQRLLSWAGHTAGRPVQDLASLWRDPSLLQDIVLSPSPSALPSDAGYVHSLAHVQELAYRRLLVPPAFSDKDLLLSELNPVLERRLFQYLQSVKRAIARRQANGPGCDEGEGEWEELEESLVADEYVVRGVGLIMASRWRPAIFYVYSRDGSSLEGVMVEVRGPGGGRGSALAGSEQPRSQSQLIDVSCRLTDEYLRVSYRPHSLGQHELSVSRHGRPLPGSPFHVTVDHISETQPKKRFNSMEWFSEDEENRKIEIQERRKNARVVSRIVDFVTEKMHLTEDGNLVKIENQQNNDYCPNNPTPCPSEVHPTPMCSQGATTKPDNFVHSKDSASSNSKNTRKNKQQLLKQRLELIRQILQNPTRRVQRKGVNSTPDVGIDSCIILENCKRILNACNYILKHFPRQKSLEIVSGAGHILQSKELLPSSPLRSHTTCENEVEDSEADHPAIPDSNGSTKKHTRNLCRTSENYAMHEIRRESENVKKYQLSKQEHLINSESPIDENKETMYKNDEIPNIDPVQYLVTENDQLIPSATTTQLKKKHSKENTNSVNSDVDNDYKKQKNNEEQDILNMLMPPSIPWKENFNKMQNSTNKNVTFPQFNKTKSTRDDIYCNQKMNFNFNVHKPLAKNVKSQIVSKMVARFEYDQLQEERSLAPNKKLNNCIKNSLEIDKRDLKKESREQKCLLTRIPDKKLFDPLYSLQNSQEQPNRASISLEPSSTIKSKIDLFEKAVNSDGSSFNNMLVGKKHTKLQSNVTERLGGEKDQLPEICNQDTTNSKICLYRARPALVVSKHYPESKETLVKSSNGRIDVLNNLQCDIITDIIEEETCKDGKLTSERHVYRADPALVVTKHYSGPFLTNEPASNCSLHSCKDSTIPKSNLKESGVNEEQITPEVTDSINLHNSENIAKHSTKTNLKTTYQVKKLTDVGEINSTDDYTLLQTENKTVGESSGKKSVQGQSECTSVSMKHGLDLFEDRNAPGKKTASEKEVDKPDSDLNSLQENISYNFTKKYNSLKIGDSVIQGCVQLPIQSRSPEVNKQFLAKVASIKLNKACHIKTRESHWCRIGQSVTRDTTTDLGKKGLIMFWMKETIQRPVSITDPTLEEQSIRTLLGCTRVSRTFSPKFNSHILTLSTSEPNKSSISNFYTNLQCSDIDIFPLDNIQCQREIRDDTTKPIAHNDNENKITWGNNNPVLIDFDMSKIGTNSCSYEYFEQKPEAKEANLNQVQNVETLSVEIDEEAATNSQLHSCKKTICLDDDIDFICEHSNIEDEQLDAETQKELQEIEKLNNTSDSNLSSLELTEVNTEEISYFNRLIQSSGDIAHSTTVTETDNKTPPTQIEDESFMTQSAIEPSIRNTETSDGFESTETVSGIEEVLEYASVHRENHIQKSTFIISDSSLISTSPHQASLWNVVMNETSTEEVNICINSMEIAAEESFVDRLISSEDPQLSISTDSDSLDINVYPAKVELNEKLEFNTQNAIELDSKILENYDFRRKSEEDNGEKKEQCQLLEARTPSPSLRSLELYFRDDNSSFDTDKFYAELTGAVIRDIKNSNSILVPSDDICDTDEPIKQHRGEQTDACHKIIVLTKEDSPEIELNTLISPFKNMQGCTHLLKSVDTEVGTLQSQVEEMNWIISPNQYPRVLLVDTSHMVVIDEEDHQFVSETTNPKLPIISKEQNYKDVQNNQSDEQETGEGDLCDKQNIIISQVATDSYPSKTELIDEEKINIVKDRLTPESIESASYDMDGSTVEVELSAQNVFVGHLIHDLNTIKSKTENNRLLKEKYNTVDDHVQNSMDNGATENEVDMQVDEVRDRTFYIGQNRTVDHHLAAISTVDGRFVQENDYVAVDHITKEQTGEILIEKEPKIEIEINDQSTKVLTEQVINYPNINELTNEDMRFLDVKYNSTTKHLAQGEARDIFNNEEGMKEVELSNIKALNDQKTDNDPNSTKNLAINEGYVTDIYDVVADHKVNILDEDTLNDKGNIKEVEINDIIISTKQLIYHPSRTKMTTVENSFTKENIEATTEYVGGAMNEDTINRQRGMQDVELCQQKISTTQLINNSETTITMIDNSFLEENGDVVAELIEKSTVEDTFNKEEAVQGGKINELDLLVDQIISDDLNTTENAIVDNEFLKENYAVTTSEEKQKNSTSDETLIEGEDMQVKTCNWNDLSEQVTDNPNASKPSTVEDYFLEVKDHAAAEQPGIVNFLAENTFHKDNLIKEVEVTDRSTLGEQVINDFNDIEATISDGRVLTEKNNVTAEQSENATGCTFNNETGVPEVKISEQKIHSQQRNNDQNTNKVMSENSTTLKQKHTTAEHKGNATYCDKFYTDEQVILAEFYEENAVLYQNEKSVVGKEGIIELDANTSDTINIDGRFLKGKDDVTTKTTEKALVKNALNEEEHMKKAEINDENKVYEQNINELISEENSLTTVTAERYLVQGNETKNTVTAVVDSSYLKETNPKEYHKGNAADGNTSAEKDPISNTQFNGDLNLLIHQLTIEANTSETEQETKLLEESLNKTEYCSPAKVNVCCGKEEHIKKVDLNAERSKVLEVLTILPNISENVAKDNSIMEENDNTVENVSEATTKYIFGEEECIKEMDLDYISDSLLLPRQLNETNISVTAQIDSFMEENARPLDLLGNLTTDDKEEGMGEIDLNSESKALIGKSLTATKMSHTVLEHYAHPTENDATKDLIGVIGHRTEYEISKNREPIQNMELNDEIVALIDQLSMETNTFQTTSKNDCFPKENDTKKEFVENNSNGDLSLQTNQKKQSNTRGKSIMLLGQSSIKTNTPEACDEEQGKLEVDSINQEKTFSNQLNTETNTSEPAPVNNSFVEEHFFVVDKLETSTDENICVDNEETKEIDFINENKVSFDQIIIEQKVIETAAHEKILPQEIVNSRQNLALAIGDNKHCNEEELTRKMDFNDEGQVSLGQILIETDTIEIALQDNSTLKENSNTAELLKNCVADDTCGEKECIRDMDLNGESNGLFGQFTIETATKDNNFHKENDITADILTNEINTPGTAPDDGVLNENDNITQILENAAAESTCGEEKGMKVMGSHYEHSASTVQLIIDTYTMETVADKNTFPEESDTSRKNATLGTADSNDCNEEEPTKKINCNEEENVLLGQLITEIDTFKTTMVNNSLLKENYNTAEFLQNCKVHNTGEEVCIKETALIEDNNGLFDQLATDFTLTETVLEDKSFFKDDIIQEKVANVVDHISCDTENITKVELSYENNAEFTHLSIDADIPKNVLEETSFQEENVAASNNAVNNTVHEHCGEGKFLIDMDLNGTSNELIAQLVKESTTSKSVSTEHSLQNEKVNITEKLENVTSNNPCIEEACINEMYLNGDSNALCNQLTTSSSEMALEGSNLQNVGTSKLDTVMEEEKLLKQKIKTSEHEENNTADNWYGGEEAIREIDLIGDNNIVFGQLLREENIPTSLQKHNSFQEVNDESTEQIENTKIYKKCGMEKADLNCESNLIFGQRIYEMSPTKIEDNSIPKESEININNNMMEIAKDNNTLSEENIAAPIDIGNVTADDSCDNKEIIKIFLDLNDESNVLFGTLNTESNLSKSAPKYNNKETDSNDTSKSSDQLIFKNITSKTVAEKTSLQEEKDEIGEYVGTATSDYNNSGNEECIREEDLSGDRNLLFKDLNINSRILETTPNSSNLLEENVAQHVTSLNQVTNSAETRQVDKPNNDTRYKEQEEHTINTETCKEHQREENQFCDYDMLSGQVKTESNENKILSLDNRFQAINQDAAEKLQDTAVNEIISDNASALDVVCSNAMNVLYDNLIIELNQCEDIMVDEDYFGGYDTTKEYIDNTTTCEEEEIMQVDGCNHDHALHEVTRINPGVGESFWNKNNTIEGPLENYQYNEIEPTIPEDTLVKHSFEEDNDTKGLSERHIRADSFSSNESFRDKYSLKNIDRHNENDVTFEKVITEPNFIQYTNLNRSSLKEGTITNDSLGKIVSNNNCSTANCSTDKKLQEQNSVLFDQIIVEPNFIQYRLQSKGIVEEDCMTEKLSRICFGNANGTNDDDTDNLEINKNISNKLDQVISESNTISTPTNVSLSTDYDISEESFNNSVFNKTYHNENNDTKGVHESPFEAEHLGCFRDHYVSPENERILYRQSPVPNQIKNFLNESFLQVDNSSANYFETYLPNDEYKNEDNARELELCEESNCEMLSNLNKPDKTYIISEIENALGKKCITTEQVNDKNTCPNEKSTRNEEDNDQKTKQDQLIDDEASKVAITEQSDGSAVKEINTKAEHLTDIKGYCTSSNKEHTRVNNVPQSDETFNNYTIIETNQMKTTIEDDTFNVDKFVTTDHLESAISKARDSTMDAVFNDQNNLLIHDLILNQIGNKISHEAESVAQCEENTFISGPSHEEEDTMKGVIHDMNEELLIDQVKIEPDQVKSAYLEHVVVNEVEITTLRLEYNNKLVINEYIDNDVTTFNDTLPKEETAPHPLQKYSKKINENKHPEERNNGKEISDYKKSKGKENYHLSVQTVDKITQLKNDSKVRFERAKAFFQQLENSSPEVTKYSGSSISQDQGSDPQAVTKLTEDYGSSLCKKSPPRTCKVGLRGRKRGKKKSPLVIQSAPASDTETSKRIQHDESFESFGGSVRSRKVSERFNVIDLFNDVTEKVGMFRGTPNRQALLASLKSVDDASYMSAYQLDSDNVKHPTNLGSIPSGFQKEYPYLPTTPIDKFLPRSDLGHTLIPRNQLLKL